MENNMSNTNINDETQLLAENRVSEQNQTENNLENSTADGKTVYVGTQWQDDKLYAVDAETGAKIWSYNKGVYTPYSAPTVVDGTIYIGYDNGPRGSLHAVNAVTGEKEWIFEAGDWVRQSPTVVNGTVYFGSHDNKLYAVDASTGSKEWEFAKPSTSLMHGGGASVADGIVYTGTKDGNVYAVDAETGDQVWQFTQSEGGDLTLYRGTVFVAGSGVLYAVNADTGNQSWKFETANDGIGSPTPYSGTVYIGSGGGEQGVYAVNAETGEQEWKRTGNSNSSSPTVHNGVLYVGRGSVLRALRPNSGDPIWTFTKPDGRLFMPTVYDGTVYVGSTDETLYAVDADTGKQQWTFNNVEHWVRVPTVVDNPKNGSSSGSRVNLGTLGHHNVWASKQRTSGLDAKITQSAGTLTLEETVTVDAGNSTGQIDNYEWDFGDGTTATGQSASHSYDTTGSYTITLTVTGDGTTDTTTSEVVVEAADQLSFAIQPSNPAVGQKVSFEASGGSTYHWNFDDGATASGSQAVHTYDSAGTYTVTLFSESNSVTGDISIESSDLQIAGIDRSAGGVPLEGISYQETFTATVIGDATVKQVDFELGGSYKIDTDGTDDWSATFDLGTLSETSILTVTAVAESGATVSQERTVKIIPYPEWIEWILNQGQVTVTEAKTNIDIDYEPFNLNSYSFSLGDIPIDADPPDFDGAPQAGIDYDASQQSALVSGEGGLDTTLFGYGFNSNFDMQGQVDKNLDLLSASGTATVSLEIQIGPPLYVDPPNWIPCLSDQIGIETSVKPGLTLQGNFGGDFQFQDGTVSPSVAITVGAQLTLCGAGAGASATGSLSGSFDVGTDSRNLSGTVSATGEAWFNLSVWTGTITVKFETQLGSQTQTRTVPVTAAGETVDWTVTDKHGSQPAADISSVDDGTSTPTQPLEATTTSPDAYERLTDRSIEDTQPSVATSGSDTVVVWSRLHGSKAVTDGRDIAVRRKSNGSWSSISSLTDNTTPEEAPVIAATDNGKLLAAWEHVDTTITDDTNPGNIHPHVEIAYAVYDGNQWSNPTTLTDSSSREFQPTVTPDGNGWLLAWASDPALDTNDRDVRYIRIASDGSAGSISRITDATYPAAGSHPDSGAVLGYASLSSGSTDQVVSAKITNGSQSDVTQFSATDVTAVTVGHDRVVWQEGPTNDPTLRNGNRQSGSVTDLTIRDAIDAVAEPDLATDGQDTVLAYRAYVESTDSRKLVYRLDRGNGWIFDRQYVQPPASDETVWQPTAALATDDQHFTTAFAITEQIKTGKNDIFVAKHDFRAEYGVQSSGPSGASGGETVTLDYTVKNTGDVDGTADVALTVENGTGTVASKTLNPLAAGATTSGTVDVTVDKTGEFTLSVSTNQATMTTTAGTTDGFNSGKTTVTVATPDISVADVRAGATDTVQIDIRNDGGAAAFNIPVAVSDGTTELTRKTVSEIGVGKTETMLMTVDPTNIDRTGEDRIILDPEETNPDAVSSTARVTPTWLLQPDLVLTDEITYRSAGNGTVNTEILVGNESPITADATVQVIRQSDSTVLGEKSVSIQGVSTGTAYEFVSVPLDSSAVSADTALEVTVDSTVPDQNPSTNTTTDDYGPVFDSPAELSEQWRDEGSKSVQSASPAVDTDTVYVGGLRSEFQALSRAQQASQVLWSEKRDGALSDSAPTMAAGLVFVGSGGGTLYAFNPSSSDQRVAWTYETDSAITSSPAVLNGTVYVGANDGTVHAVTTDGSVAWSSPVDVGSPVYSKVAAANSQVFVTTNDGSVTAVDAGTGNQAWSVDTGVELGSTGPAVANGTVYVGADNVYALDVSDGSQQWQDSSNYDGTVGSTPTVANGTVYVGSADGYLYALNTSDGSVQWRFETDGAIAAAPTVANGRVAVASLAGTVYLLDDQGTQLASQSLGEPIRAAPVRAGYEVLVATEQGTILKFDTGGGT
jgi:outer membrane protein assembly factor BamB